jgi:hypothetical protein
MKKLLFTALLMAAVSLASFSREVVASGKTHTSLGDYKVVVSDNPVTVNNEALKTYEISYQNSPMVVRVAIMKGKKCKDFIVLSDKLCVKYVCNKDYFGVEKLSKEIADFETSDAALNRMEYFHQKKITEGMQSELENTRLIAAYFPMLLRDESKGSM